MNIIKNRTSKFQSNIFIWNMMLSGNDTYATCSNYFEFCGYYCYLSFEFEGLILKGFVTPHTYEKNISCDYSINLKCTEGNELLNKTGEIKTTLNADNYIVLHEESYCYNPRIGCTPSICFLWCEDKDSNVFSQGVQTDPERSINVLERGTQMEEVYVLERGTQTEDVHTSPKCYNLPQTENEDYKFLDILSNDLKSFFENQTDPDCVLAVGDTKFPVHRSILSARSSVFAAMFHHDTSESQSGEVNIRDVDTCALGDVLYFIYTGKIRGLSPDTAVSMYVIADKYALIDFRDKCLHYLICNLTSKNICDAAIMAHAHAEIVLENKVVEFIKESLEEIIESEQWKHFLDTHYKLANELLCSALISYKREKI